MTRDEGNIVPVKSTPSHGSDGSWPNAIVGQAWHISNFTQAWQELAYRISAYPLGCEPWNTEKEENSYDNG